MGSFSPAVDQIIGKALPFAQPVLIHLRELVHAVCHETEEKIKWGMPYFEYRGKNLCAMASFKQHCSFGLWYQTVLSDPDGVFARAEEGGMGSFGKIRSLEDLPSDEQIEQLILESMSLIERGVKNVVKGPDKHNWTVPEILATALKKDKVAAEAFEKFSNSHKWEYVQWIDEAKTEATKIKRTQTTIENLREGKSKEWKYKR